MFLVATRGDMSMSSNTVPHADPNAETQIGSRPDDSSPISTLWRACWAPEDSLTAEEAASTQFRFFRSKHVADLRWIAKLAMTLLVIDFIVVAIYLFFDPIRHLWTNWDNYNGLPVGHGFKVLIDRGWPTVFTYFGPAVTVFGGVIAWAYLAAASRLGIVDLFACEISTLCRVGTIFDVGKHNVDAYHSKGDAAEKHAAAQHAAGKPVMDEQSPRSFVSQENYFPVFDNNSSDLKSLEALVVRNITEYYTYMKAVRDLQRRLASIGPAQISKAGKNAADGLRKEDLWHETLANIIYVLFLGYESARKSISDLIEFEPTRAEETIVILLTELVCYAFLCDHLKDDDVRFRRLQLRETDYRKIVPALILDVKTAHVGNEKYWAPAERTISELEARYDAAMKTLQK